MFTLVILGLFFGIFALFGIGAIAFVDVAFRPAPQETRLGFVSCPDGQDVPTRRLPEMPKTHVA